MKEDIEKCLEVLIHGGTILYPTDTVWGIGCDATNENAVQKIFKIKQRDANKSMIVLVAEVEQIKKYADFPPKAAKLLEQAQKPLTIIYPNAKKLAQSVIAADRSVAIRVVKDEFCKKIINKFGKPIVSTSANISGQATQGSFAEISEIVKKQVNYAVKWRQAETIKNSPSGIIRINANGTTEVIRA